MSGALEITALAGIPEIEAGDGLAEPIATALAAAGLELADETIVVISQKVVSKAEGLLVSLATVEPGPRARELAAALDKDPRMVELVLRESTRVVRAGGGVLITETHGGWICANAGIDSSNVAGEDVVALLPRDADASARRLRSQLAERCGVRPGVIVADSFGRPWRHGQTDVAIGLAGVAAIDDWRGRTDSAGRPLRATAIAVADQLAAAADLARSKTSATPVVIVEGAGRWRTEEDGPGAASLQRPPGEDLFR